MPHAVFLQFLEPEGSDHTKVTQSLFYVVGDENGHTDRRPHGQATSIDVL